MKSEQKHILAIKQIDEERKAAVANLVAGQSRTAYSATLSDCLPFLQREEQDELLTVQNQLLNQIDQLKEVNKLNQQLIEQSLQFVNLSIDMIYLNHKKLPIISGLNMTSRQQIDHYSIRKLNEMREKQDALYIYGVRDCTPRDAGATGCSTNDWT